MSLPVKIIGALGVVALAFWVTLMTLNYVAPLCPQGKRTFLKPPYATNGGYAYTAQLPDMVNPGDTGAIPRHSQLLFCEDNRLLGPAHSLHVDIRSLGRGRLSHWEANLIFSASDNTDPNTNSRQYSFVIPDAAR